MGSRKNRKGRPREKELQENVPPLQASSVDRSAAGKHRQPGDIGWRYNQTFVKVRSSLGFKSVASFHPPYLILGLSLEQQN